MPTFLRGSTFLANRHNLETRFQWPQSKLAALLHHLRRPGGDRELTRFELLAGARPDEHDRLESFFSVLGWVPVTADVTRRAGEYARAYRRSHSGIGVLDYLLAGTAYAVGADVLTTNVRHFPMFDDLQPPYSYGPPEQRRTRR